MDSCHDGHPTTTWKAAVAVARLLLTCDVATCASCCMAQDGVTSLMIASEKGHTETATVLLANGADVNAATKVCVPGFVL